MWHTWRSMMSHVTLTMSSVMSQVSHISAKGDEIDACWNVYQVRYDLEGPGRDSKFSRGLKLAILDFAFTIKLSRSNCRIGTCRMKLSRSVMRLGNIRCGLVKFGAPRSDSGRFGAPRSDSERFGVTRCTPNFPKSHRIFPNMSHRSHRIIHESTRPVVYSPCYKK